MSIPTKNNSSLPKEPKQLGAAEIDVDDALIEPPKDDAFKEKDPNQDNPAHHLMEENLEPFHYRG